MFSCLLMGIMRVNKYGKFQNNICYGFEKRWVGMKNLAKTLSQDAGSYYTVNVIHNSQNKQDDDDYNDDDYDDFDDDDDYNDYDDDDYDDDDDDDDYDDFDDDDDYNDYDDDDESVFEYSTRVHQ